MTWGILTEQLGGTDITDGNVLYADDLVSTFDVMIDKMRGLKIGFYPIESSSTGNDTSWATVRTLNFETLDLEVYTIMANLRFGLYDNNSFTVSLRLKYTLDDNSVEYSATKSQNSNYPDQTQTNITYSSTKKIKKVEIQMKTSNSSYDYYLTGGIYDSQSDSKFLIFNGIQYLSMGTYS